MAEATRPATTWKTTYLSDHLSEEDKKFLDELRASYYDTSTNTSGKEIMTFQVGDRVEVVGYDKPNTSKWDGKRGIVTMIGIGGTVYMDTDDGYAVGFQPQHLRYENPNTVLAQPTPFKDQNGNELHVGDKVRTASGKIGVIHSMREIGSQKILTLLLENTATLWTVEADAVCVVCPAASNSSRSMLDQALDRPTPKKKERVPDEIDWDKHKQFMRDL